MLNNSYIKATLNQKHSAAANYLTNLKQHKYFGESNFGQNEPLNSERQNVTTNLKQEEVKEISIINNRPLKINYQISNNVNTK